MFLIPKGWRGVALWGNLEDPTPHLRLLFDSRHDPSSVQDIYDLASLSKVILTSTTLADLCLEEHQKNATGWPAFLAQPLVHEIPELMGTAFEKLTLQEAWEHRGGLPAHVKIFGEERHRHRYVTREDAWNQVLSQITPLKAVGREVYSDLSFLLLGCFIERRKKMSLDTLWRMFKRQSSLDESILSFRPAGTSAAGPASGVVPTENRHPAGQVNDDNAWGLRGIASHAGLFGKVHDVWAYLAFVKKWTDANPFLKTWTQHPQSHRFHCGWDHPEGEKSQGGFPAPAEAIGHLGWTGTAMWWDPESGRAGVLLTNRVHPLHSEESQAMMREFRHGFFSALWQGTLDLWLENQKGAGRI